MSSVISQTPAEQTSVTAQESCGKNPYSGTKIVHVTTVHTGLDTRIFHKECVSLQKAGFDVTIICCQEKDEVVEGVKLHAIPKPQGRLQRIVKTQWQAFRAALSEKGDIYQLHDPELMPLGLALRACGKRVVYDVHEDNRLKIWEKQYISYPIRVVLSWLVGRIEDFCGWVYNGIVTVTPHIARHFPEKKTVLVRNYPEYGEFELKEPPPYASRPNNVTYVGSITANRGAWRMLQAVHKLNTEENLNAKLILAGPIGTPELEQELRNSPEWASVDYRGFLSREGIGEVLCESRVGILVYDATPCYIDSYPMKMFEFMSAGLPVVAADFPVWKEIVDGARCGLLIDTMDVQGIADAISYLFKHPDEAEAMGQRGKVDAFKLYYWEREAETLVSLYRRILKLQ